MLDWTGTWLQAVWLVRPQRLAEWRRLLDVWSRSAAFDHGTALLVAVPPESATHRSLENPDFLPELRWAGNRQLVLDAMRQKLPRALGTHASEKLGISTLRVNSIVNSDDSLSLYLSVPLNLFEGVDDAVGRRRFSDFLAICSELFVPEVVLAGTIAEEAQLHGLEALEREIGRWTGRAFYGGRACRGTGGVSPRHARSRIQTTTPTRRIVRSVGRVARMARSPSSLA